MSSNGRTPVVLWILIVGLLLMNGVTLGLLLRQHSVNVRQREQIAELQAANEGIHFPSRGGQAAESTSPDIRALPPLIPGAFANVKESEIPGRYRWFESEKDRGIITLNADRTFTLANGQQLESYRWTLSRDQLAMEFNRQTSYYTNVKAPGIYVGVRTDRKSQRLEKIE